MQPEQRQASVRIRRTYKVDNSDEGLTRQRCQSGVRPATAWVVFWGCFFTLDYAWTRDQSKQACNTEIKLATESGAVGCYISLCGFGNVQKELLCTMQRSDDGRTAG